MINAYKSGTIVILYLQIIEKEGHPYQNENVAAVLPQYCRNIDLLPEIPGFSLKAATLPQLRQ